MAEKFFVTTPIYYVNARPHIGHAYTTIVADVLARRARAQGIDTFFLTGTDEHGQKIERSALAAGVPPQQFTDDVSAAFRTLWDRMGLTYDQFIRTSSEAHKRGAQQLFRDLFDRGYIYLSSYTGQYSIGEEMFVEGPPGTIGPDGKPTETVTEENFFFRLSDFQLPLLDLIESDTLKITPEARKNEVLSFLRGDVWQEPSRRPHRSEQRPDGTLVTGEGAMKPHIAAAVVEGELRLTSAGTPYVPGALRDLSISRSSFTWGVPVPPDIQQAVGAQNPHIIYVWLDALANYITALGFGDPTRSAEFEKWWPADLHLVGKEIIRFHCVYWPAFLLAAGLPLPKAVTAHGWLLFDDSKMSKSKGNIVRTETILEAFGTLCPAPSPPSAGPVSLLSLRSEAEESAVPLPTAPTPHDRDLFAADVLRYFLLREIPFGQDGSFTFEALITRYNADLANGYGNLVSRTLKLLSTSMPASYPRPEEPYVCSGQDFVGTAFIVQSVKTNVDLCAGKSGDIGLNAVLAQLQQCVGLVDGYLSFHKPWVLAKSTDEAEKKKLVEVLYTAAESIRIITALLYPILPYATGSVWRQLGLGDIEQAARSGQLKNLQWGGLQPGTKLGPLSPIFPRADKKLAETMTQMEQDKTLGNITAQADAGTDTRSEFPVTSLASEVVASPVEDHAPFDPAAGPRTSTLAEPNPGAHVGASAALTTERPGTPPHQEAPASGIFSAASSPSAQPSAALPADSSPQITIEDFARVELRVAQILVAERIPKADKLLRLEVDLGHEKRQILSGIAEWYAPEDLVGRRIVVITNLAPRKMRGLESHGMLLAASSEGGKPHLATFDAAAEAMPLGSRLK